MHQPSGFKSDIVCDREWKETTWSIYFAVSKCSNIIKCCLFFSFQAWRLKPAKVWPFPLDMTEILPLPKHSETGTEALRSEEEVWKVSNFQENQGQNNECLVWLTLYFLVSHNSSDLILTKYSYRLEFNKLWSNSVRKHLHRIQRN